MNQRSIEINQRTISLNQRSNEIKQRTKKIKEQPNLMIALFISLSSFLILRIP
jgi:hypothetical protein